MKLTDLLSQRNHAGREPDFSHMPKQTVEDYIALKLKKRNTEKDAQRIAEIEAIIRYKPSSRKQKRTHAPRGSHESAEAYLRRVLFN